MSKIIRNVEHIVDRTPSLNRYLNDMMQTPLERLSERDRLIIENHSLAMAIVLQYGGHQGQSIEDLLGAAMLGLCIAAERFDPAMGCTFSTYAPQWIRKMVAEQLATDTHSIRIPTRMQMLRQRVVSEQERYFAVHGYETTPEDVAKELNVEPEQVQSVWLPLDFTTSLNSTVGHDDDDSYTLADTLADTDDEDAKQQAEIRDKVERILDKLTPQQREILVRYYFNGEDFQSIGRAINLTATRVRQIHRAICPF